ncbi:MAG TPA: SRPBCC domain-containing protein [Candidatus Thermoplasmatota archaeon]|nr:SRPBCC domain-containing protein [Candidatus Thermoplasmatota archaeon]
MAAKMETQTLRLERVYDATPEELWEAWTDPAIYARWFNPFPGKDAIIHEWDPRPGGRIRFSMVGPDGTQYPNEGRFLVLDRPRELVTGEETLRTRVLFEPAHGKTRMIVEQTGLPASVPLDQARAGWGAILDKLGERATRGMSVVEGRAIVSTRLLDAPRERVYAAWTRRDEIDAWWGPDGFTNRTHAMDVRKGGEWRFDMVGPDGRTYPNLVRYDEVAPPERLRFAHGSPEDPGQMEVEVTFASEGPRTRLTMRTTLRSEEAVEAVRSFGAVELGLQTLARLAAHVAP